MNSKRFHRLLFGLVPVFFVLCSSTPAWTQTGSYTKINPKGKKAYSIAVSDNTLTFEITLASGKIAKMLVREGEMAKFGVLSEGYAFAFVPIIKDMDKKSARVTILILTQDEKGNEMVRQVEQVDARLESAITTNTKPKFQIRLISIKEARSSSASADNSERFALESAITTNTKPKFQIKLISIEEARSSSASADNLEQFAGVPCPKLNSSPDCCVFCLDIWACSLCV